MGISTQKDYKFTIQTQESKQESTVQQNGLKIGVPKEIMFQENRVALSPLSVGLLVQNGHQVIMQSGAGKGSNFSDHHYSEQGAQIVEEATEVYTADILVKIASPTLEEIRLMKPRQTLLSFQQPHLMGVQELKLLMQKKITALSYECLKDEAGNSMVVEAMGEIIGSTAVLIAAEYLSNVFGGKGLMLGGITGIPPTEIVIIGADTVGEFATRTAIALGAQVKLFDDSVYRLKRLQDLVGNRLYTSIMQPKLLNKAVKSCDVVIGAISSTGSRTPCVLSEDVISKMKPDSVLIDTCMDRGGCFETSEITTHQNPIFRKHEVIHYCVPNIPSRVARTATYSLTNILTPLMLNMGERGGINGLIWSDQSTRTAIYLYNGALTSKDMAERFGLSAKDLNLIALSKF
ncbi:MAG TPA: alanine dehydrogenase [Candidatus Sphingobacterium stercoripullorum]|nr:alanine dehydrogenase [Candidatus Sphingobacterium stercoripullorum]